MIKQKELKEMLDRLMPQRWSELDFRKMADGRVVRFVAWRAKAEKNYGCAEVRHA